MNEYQPALGPSAAASSSSLGWGAEFRALFMLAWPLIIAQLARSALFTTDVIMLGWLGAKYVAAGALATIGVATLRHVREPRTILFASVPLLFAFHQFTEGVVWGIDSFDQWGVELGKQLALQIAPAIEGDAEALASQDASTRALLEYYAAHRKA